MRRAMSNMFPYLLFSVKVALLIWGLLGLWEYISPSAALGLQNPNFPDGTQLLHWLLLILTGAIFVVGFLVRWPPTPFATVTMYATLATLCFIETLDFGAFGGGLKGLLIMSGEFLLYIGLSVYLLRSNTIERRFQERF